MIGWLCFYVLTTTASAGDVSWDLSQRWRHNRYFNLYALDTDGIASIDGNALTVAHEASWYQRTRFSANIADKHAVQMMLGTDGEFKRIRQLAAAYLGPRFIIGYERGSTPQSFEHTDAEPIEPTMPIELALPEDLSSEIRFDNLSLQYNVFPESWAFVGGSFFRFELPTQIDNTMLDGRTVFLAAGPSARVDRARYVLTRGCDRSVCVDGTTEDEIFLGLGSARGSEEAQERYDEHNGSGPGSMGFFSFTVYQSVGLLFTVPVGKAGMLGIEGGASYRVFMLSRLGSSGTQYGDIYEGDFMNMPIYAGPHFEVYSRF